MSAFAPGRLARPARAPTCGKVSVAEVEGIVPVGSLDPDCIHLPSIYVKRLILGAPYDKRIEFKTVREGGGVMFESENRTRAEST